MTYVVRQCQQEHENTQAVQHNTLQLSDSRSLADCYPQHNNEQTKLFVSRHSPGPCHSPKKLHGAAQAAAQDVASQKPAGTAKHCKAPGIAAEGSAGMGVAPGPSFASTIHLLSLNAYKHAPPAGQRARQTDGQTYRHKETLPHAPRTPWTRHHSAVHAMCLGDDFPQHPPATCRGTWGAVAHPLPLKQAYGSDARQRNLAKKTERRPAHTREIPQMVCHHNTCLALLNKAPSRYGMWPQKTSSGKQSNVEQQALTQLTMQAKQPHSMALQASCSTPYPLNAAARVACNTRG